MPLAHVRIFVKLIMYSEDKLVTLDEILRKEFRRNLQFYRKH
jgi:hypothetical protein